MTKDKAIQLALEAIENGELFSYFDDVVAPALRDALKIDRVTSLQAAHDYVTIELLNEKIDYLMKKIADLESKPT